MQPGRKGRRGHFCLFPAKNLTLPLLPELPVAPGRGSSRRRTWGHGDTVGSSSHSPHAASRRWRRLRLGTRSPNPPPRAAALPNYGLAALITAGTCCWPASTGPRRAGSPNPAPTSPKDARFPKRLPHHQPLLWSWLFPNTAQGAARTPPLRPLPQTPGSCLIPQPAPRFLSSTNPPLGAKALGWSTGLSRR